MSPVFRPVNCSHEGESTSAGGIPGKTKMKTNRKQKNSREDINLRWCFLGKQDCVSFYVCRVL